MSLGEEATYQAPASVTLKQEPATLVQLAQTTTASTDGGMHSHFGNAEATALPTPPTTDSATFTSSTHNSSSQDLQQQQQAAPLAPVAVANDLDNIPQAAPAPIQQQQQPNGDVAHHQINGVQERVASPVSIAEAQAAGIFGSLPPSAAATPLEGSPALQQPQSAPVSYEQSPAPAPVVAPPAPISAPETLPPPPVVPLPSHHALPPQVRRVDSSSSVIAQPPTPSASGVPPPPPPAQLPQQQQQQQYIPSPAPESPAPQQSHTSPAPAPAPAAAPAAGYAYPPPPPTVDVKMEEGAGEVSPSLLKRSAPDESSPHVGQGQLGAQDERDVKRVRVDSEVRFASSARSRDIADRVSLDE